MTAGTTLGPEPDSPPAREDGRAAERVRHLRERHNRRVLQNDSLVVGVVNAATPFLPVLVARLGGSSVDVGLITVVPAVAALVLAVPIGAWLETRRNLVGWFSGSRLVAWLGYVAIALAIAVVPARLAVPAIIAVWIAIAAPLTVGQVAFNIVMNDAAGAGGRYELLGRRWATMSLTTAAAVAATGWLLDRLTFPANYEVAFLVFGLAGIFAARFENQIRLVRPPGPESTGRSLRAMLRHPSMVRIAHGQRFVRYLVAHVVVSAGIRLVTPVITLFYVRGVHASDAEIGLIVTASSLATFGGFHVWRRIARRRGGRTVLLTSAALTAIYPIALGLSPNPLVAGIVTAFGAAGGAGLSLALFDELMRRVPADRAIALTAVDYAASNAIGIAAPLAGALLADQFGLPAALAVGGFIGLAGTAIFALERRPADEADRHALSSLDPV